MRTTNEYLPCPHESCKGWARIEHGEKGYRDRLVCSKCGAIIVMDGIPRGQQLQLKEEEKDETDL